MANAADKIEGRTLHQYFMDRTAARYIFKNGKVAEFFGGVYYTEIQSEIDELAAEIKGGIGSIWQVKGQETISSLDLDPVAVMKKKVIAEYLAEQARANANGESTSEVTGVKAAGSAVAGTVAATSNAGAAKPVSLAGLKIGPK